MSASSSFPKEHRPFVLGYRQNLSGRELDWLRYKSRRWLDDRKGRDSTSEEAVAAERDVGSSKENEPGGNESRQKKGEIDPDTLLLSYILEEQVEGIFFADSEGNRAIWGKNIKYFTAKDNFRRHPAEWWDEGNDRDGRRYFFPARKQKLQEIDQPKAFGSQIAHPSQFGGWKRSKKHRRHILKFPLDILLRILSFLVLSPKFDVSIAPHPIKWNYTKAWRLPHHVFVDRYSQDQEIPVIGSYEICRIGSDEDGEYVEKRKVYQKIIDSTILRTCKTFNVLGSQLLYGLNTFHFRLFHSSSPHLIGVPGKRKVWWPKPRMSETPLILDIDTALDIITRGGVYTTLPPWAHCEDFLRWILMIRPEKAAMIKSLEFSAGLASHKCCEQICSEFGHDLPIKVAWKLKLYLPFIIRFFPLLRKLTLFIDQRSWPVEQDGSALREFLENDLFSIPGLEQLQVTDLAGTEDCPRLARDAVEWLRLRGIVNSRLDAKARAGYFAADKGKGKAKMICDICKSSSHMWEDCYEVTRMERLAERALVEEEDVGVEL